MKKLKTLNRVSLGGIAVMILLCISCSAPKYVSLPKLDYPVLSNVCTFGIQNMDENAKVEDNSLTCHYDGFDVSYRINENFVPFMVFINNSNKSLIIDKSKCYVLYNGYSTQLFKDVRSSRSTTFNNVQDAINNVQTNESGVSMTIPPYSKWELPIPETNIREIQKLPQFIDKIGIHALTPYDDQETVEFVIPYTFDYALANWNTCRNRLSVKSIEVKEGNISYRFDPKIERTSSINHYLFARINGEPDYSRLRRVEAQNEKTYKKHLRRIRASHAVWGIVTFPFGAMLVAMWEGCPHLPPRYIDMEAWDREKPLDDMIEPTSY